MVKEYVNTVEKMCGKYSAWEIWSDFISMSAISLSNSWDLEQMAEREKIYLQIVKKYDKKDLEIFCGLMARLVMDLEKCTEQDILGEVYQNLSMNSKINAQYFTPYYLSRMMAQMIIGTECLEDTPIFINEPACGSGANLIATANAMREKGVDYQKEVYFVAQDIDPLVAKMCYIQMSLLGMPGIVIVGNTLNSPMQGDYWLTPFHFLFGTSILRRYKEKREENVEVLPTISGDYKNGWLLELVGIV